MLKRIENGDMSGLHCNEMYTLIHHCVVLIILDRMWWNLTFSLTIIPPAFLMHGCVFKYIMFTWHYKYMRFVSINWCAYNILAYVILRFDRISCHVWSMRIWRCSKMKVLEFHNGHHHHVYLDKRFLAIFVSTEQ